MIAPTPSRQFWEGQRVAVTGGTGFLGLHLVRQLVEAGARVSVLGLPPPQPRPVLDAPSIRCHFGDLRDRELVSRALARCQVVFHTAAIVGFDARSVRELLSSNEQVTRTVLETSPPAAQVVFTSSIVAVGASREPIPLSEDSPFTMRDLPVDYVRSKRETEELALRLGAGRNLVVVNPGYLMGPEDFGPSEMGKICKRFWKGRVPVALAGGFNVADVRDVALGHLLAAERGRASERYILGGTNLTQQELFYRMATAAGWHPRWLPRLPSWLAMVLSWGSSVRERIVGRPAFPSRHQAILSRYYWYASSEKARRELGYQPRPLVDTLAETCPWFQQFFQVEPRGLYRWWMGVGRSSGHKGQTGSLESEKPVEAQQLPVVDGGEESMFQAREQLLER